MVLKAKLMDSVAVDRALTRISHEIIEKNDGVENLCLIGIKTRGVPIAHRLAEKIFHFENVEIPVGELDITLYRDDLSQIGETPVLSATKIDFPIENKTVIIVDDVIYTARTARAALDAVMDLGRPDKIQLVELIDRGHTELPIRANYVGKNIPTSLNEVVSVRLSETDGETNVLIYSKD